MRLQELDEGFHQQRLAGLVPPVIVVAAEEQEFVFPPVEPGDARARLVQARLGGVGGGQQEAAQVGPVAQRLEQLVADLLGAAAHQLGMEQADQQDFASAWSGRANARAAAPATGGALPTRAAGRRGDRIGGGRAGAGGSRRGVRPIRSGMIVASQVRVNSQRLISDPPSCRGRRRDPLPSRCHIGMSCSHTGVPAAGSSGTDRHLRNARTRSLR